GEFFGDVVVYVDNYAAFVVFDLFERYATHDTITQRLNDIAGFHDGADVNPIYGAAILLADDYILGHVYKTAGQVTGVSGLERRIRQTFTGAVSGDEILQHGETLTEVGGDGCLNDFTGRLGHEAAHAGELANLLLRSTGAGVGHNINRVQLADLIQLLHVVEHFIGDLLGHVRPDFDHLVVTLTVGDSSIQILLLDGNALLFCVSYQTFLVVRDDHVINADGETGLGGIAEPKFLDLIEHLDRGFQAEPQIGVVHQLTNALLLEQAIDIGHGLGQVIIQDGTAHRGIDELPLEL